MKPEEIVCTAVLQQDVEKGIDYAWKSLPYTFDRMRYGEKTTGAYLQRLKKITMGKCAEAALERFLRSHGVQHQSLEGATAHTQPDRFDFRIKNEIIDLKTFAIPQKYAEAKFVVNALALVPADQWAKRSTYHRYLFAFFAGQIRMTLKQSLKGLLSASPPTREEIILKMENSRIFLTAAPEIAECENKFKKIRAGTKCVQYPNGTRIDNMGCRIKELTAFKRVVQWGGV